MGGPGRPRTGGAGSQNRSYRYRRRPRASGAAGLLPADAFRISEVRAGILRLDKQQGDRRPELCESACGLGAESGRNAAGRSEPARPRGTRHRGCGRGGAKHSCRAAGNHQRGRAESLHRQLQGVRLSRRERLRHHRGHHYSAGRCGEGWHGYCDPVAGRACPHRAARLRR